MNLTNILYEPYVVIIILALLITIIAYFVVNSDNSNKEEEDKINMPKSLFYTFLTSFILLMGTKTVITYMNNSKMFQKGGDVNIADRLTIVADDVDIGFFDE
jgi:hypothetical protein